MAGKKRADLDWELIEKEYRVGQRSVTQIAATHSPPGARPLAPSTITRRAKKESWVRDRSAEVRQKTRAALIAQRGQEDRKAHSPPDDVVHAAVATNLEAIEQHLTSLRGQHDLVRRLMSELSASTSCIDELEDLILKETEDDGNDRRRDAMLKAVSLPARAQVLEKLAGAMAKIIPLERKALNLDETRSDDSEATQFYLWVKARPGQRLSLAIAAKLFDEDGEQEEGVIDV